MERDYYSHYANTNTYLLRHVKATVAPGFSNYRRPLEIVNPVVVISDVVDELVIAGNVVVSLKKLFLSQDTYCPLIGYSKMLIIWSGQAVGKTHAESWQQPPSEPLLVVTMKGGRAVYEPVHAQESPLHAYPTHPTHVVSQLAEVKTRYCRRPMTAIGVIRGVDAVKESCVPLAMALASLTETNTTKSSLDWTDIATRKLVA
ncbi:hypothetical protein FHL15_003706 [Xylaria flabelliformis]|uniref:Uncharacterized protein n=1 Tax=Xylaria flabelliformis TaxID=2512241 RepID=A0A553I598_9PEZI|nr:hypothetical protein FHL15_003706 [Xylaria flabelliformis]